MESAQTHVQKKPVGAWIAAILLLILLIIGYFYYQKLNGSNIRVSREGKTYLFIPTGSTYNDLLGNLEKHELLHSLNDFKWTAGVLHFGAKINPGKYLLKNGMSNKQLIRKIQLKDQEPVDIILHGLRLKENMVSYVSKRIEADSTVLFSLLTNKAFTDSLGYTPETIYTMILPNTYRVKWNTTPREFLQRMNKESVRFWTPARLAAARAIGLDKEKVIILASIVNQESNKVDEMPVIAGVYLNRLNHGIKLDADPTVIFANNDFSIKRVTRRYLIKDSPYNTYKYAGLPPGPITMPSLQAIEAVLNYRRTNYMFFCAKDDFSGYHAFAATREEHNANAHKFQKALDERNIH